MAILKSHNTVHMHKRVTPFALIFLYNCGYVTQIQEMGVGSERHTAHVPVRIQAFHLGMFQLAPTPKHTDQTGQFGSEEATSIQHRGIQVVQVGDPGAHQH